MDHTRTPHTKINELEIENKLLREEVRLLKAKLYGRSSESKKTLACDAQPGLFCVEEWEMDPSEEEPGRETVTYSRRKPRGKRQPIPAHFPRRDVIHDVSPEEKKCACGAERLCIGHEVSEQLDIIPAKIEVLRHLRPKYACKACEGLESTDGTIVIGPAPRSMIPKSIAGPGLLADVITAKFADAVPFYRHQKRLARLGIEISRTVMCQWAVKVAILCWPLVVLMRENLRTLPYLQMDETPLRVHGEEGKANTTTSYLWAIRGAPSEGPQIILFFYSPTRSAEMAKSLLDTYQGIVHTDAYRGYDFLEKQAGMTHLACWAHARRKFAEAILAAKKSKGSQKQSKAHRLLSYISKMYGREKEARAKGLKGKELKDFREKELVPIALSLKKELDELHPKVPPNGKLGKAIGYTLNLWPKLMRCLEHSEARLDTNLVENAIRPIALGRKNWLHSGSPKGAESSAILFSMIETAKVNGWEPYAYLRFLFERLPETAPDQLESLLPYIAKPSS